MPVWLSKGGARGAVGREVEQAGTGALSAADWDDIFGANAGAFGVTRGPGHTLVYANAAFRQMTAAPEVVLGDPIAHALFSRDIRDLTALLDGAFRTGMPARDRHLHAANRSARLWVCSVWPQADRSTDGCLVVELRRATESDLAIAMQRDVAERMLLGALRQLDVAAAANDARVRADSLASASRWLSASLEEGATLDAIAGVSLPLVGAWCFVDIQSDSGAAERLAIMHANPDKQVLLRALTGHWHPATGDPFGLPAVLHGKSHLAFPREVDLALTAAGAEPAVARVLREIGFGPMLTVPMHAEGRIAGAITYVLGDPEGEWMPDEARFAEDLTFRCAMALESARRHGRAVALQRHAERANESKDAFLGSMSHELRTPLAAIAGYVDLLEMGIGGTLTEEQRRHLDRIRSGQQHILSMINEIIDFVRVGAARSHFDLVNVVARDSVVQALGLVHPLLYKKHLLHDMEGCDAALVARADPDKLLQILVNLIGNAVKFTPEGGHISLACERENGQVKIHVADTGIGISADMLGPVFDPFVQVASGTAPSVGLGLGLAISRGLARAMGGDLSVTSELGKGSRFTVSLEGAHRS